MASKSETAIKFARVIAAKDKRISELEAKLAALDWSPITESNPVRLADEVLDSGSVCLALVIPENLTTDWTGCGFDYRRPLNAPVQP